MVNRLTRYAQIAKILIKYGFEIFIEELFPEDSRPRFMQSDETVKDYSVYKRIRMAIEELGPTYIKMGQILSVRSDVLPTPMIKELLKLTDDVKPIPFMEIKPIIEETCGKITDICTIDEKPLASASLSQAHRAVLHTGEEVIFKVQKPDIEEIIEVDLLILDSLAERIENLFPYLQPYNPKELVKEFSIQLRKELNFIREGKNADTIRENLKENPQIKIPKIFWEYSGEKLLVMESIKGIRIDYVNEIRKKHDPKNIIEVGFQAYLTQIFRDGFFHGDPHPGNLLVTDEGLLVFLDFGMVGILRPEKRYTYTSILYSIVSSDVNSLIEGFEDLGVIIDLKRVDSFKDEMYIVLKETQRYNLKEYSFIDSLNDITNIFYRYKVKLPGTFMLIIKVISMISKIGEQLDPDFNFIERIQPYLDDLMMDSTLNIERFEEVRQALTRDLISFPKSIRRFLDKFASGRSKIEVMVPEVNKLHKSIDKASRRLYLGVISTGIIIGVSIITLTTDSLFNSWHGWLILISIASLLIIILKSINIEK
jgi:ubiquinone biosynthesis protein